MNIIVVQNNNSSECQDCLFSDPAILCDSSHFTIKTGCLEFSSSTYEPDALNSTSPIKIIVDKPDSSSIVPSENDRKDIFLNAAILMILFISKILISGYSACIALPRDLYCLVRDFASYSSKSTCIHNDSDYSYTLHISSDFLSLTRVYSSSRSEVYKCSINQHHYAIKLMKNSLSEGELLFLNTDLHSQSIIHDALFAVNLSGASYKSLVCSEYVEGDTTHGLLSSSQTEDLIHSILLASHTMSSIDYSISNYETIYQKIKKSTNDSKTRSAVIIGTVLKDYCNYEISEREYSQLCLYDLHRENIIINDSSWHVIDTDSIIIGTSTFMLSCLLAASFLLEGYPPLYVCNTVMRAFSEKYERVYYEIMVRLYIGISFYSRKTESNILFSRYMHALHKFVLFLGESNTAFSNQFMELLNHLKGVCSGTQ